MAPKPAPKFRLGVSIGGKKSAGPAQLPTSLSPVFDLDSTANISYPGSGQSWKNMVLAPADGAAKSAYDFMLGATSGTSTDDPTFTGTAGNAAAYFSLDGGDFFQIAANTAFLASLHKTTGGGAFWLAMAFRNQNPASGYPRFFSTQNASNLQGIRLTTQSTGAVGIAQAGDASVPANVWSSQPALANGTDYLLILSCAAGNTNTQRRLWLNNRTKYTTTLTYNTTSTDASNVARIASGGPSEGGALPSGFRLYAAAMGNSFIDDAEAALIFNTFNARHGRTYA